MLKVAPLHAEQTLAEAADYDAFGGGNTGARRLSSCLLDGDWDLILQLDAVAQPVVDIEVRYLVCARSRVAVADEAKVDLPVMVARSVGVVGAKGRSTLGMGSKRSQEAEEENCRLREPEPSQ
jgi:hypothetical protein